MYSRKNGFILGAAIVATLTLGALPAVAQSSDDDRPRQQEPQADRPAQDRTERPSLRRRPPPPPPAPPREPRPTPEDRPNRDDGNRPPQLGAAWLFDR